MKKIITMMMLAVVMLGLSSCDKESEGLTSITYFPILTLEGGSTMIVDKGSQYEEPGYNAVLNGEDITSQVQVTSNVDTSKSGVYSVSYSVKNEDGFSATASRTVIVLNLASPVEGFYSTTADCHRINSAGTVTPYGSSFDILVIDNMDGTYYVEDLLGGYYSQRAGYGSAYNAEGTIAINADGSVTMIDSYVAGWGDSVDELADAKFDADTKTFSWDAQYAGMDFYVTMTKK